MADIWHTTAGATPQEPGAPARFKDLALDARDHHALADWWCAAMGYVRRPPATDEEQPRAWPVPIVDPAGTGPLIWINPVTEPKSVKNRMHLDVWGDTDRLLRLGATLVRKRDEDIAWDILADPEGNEFCVFAPPEATSGPADGS
ncbi:VOC family protein [Streptomyces sp. NPDC026294]|uniref:VOC family protein n=1 Tax=Streptomyces sp. NPDC026294 TaxID=3155362 RepID=UPI0033D16002